jgi:hypothetical protein
MNDSIFIFDYDFDKEELLKTFNEHKHTAIKYSDFRGVQENWFMIKVEDTKYIKKIKNDFKILDAKPRFYIQKANFILPKHRDLNTKCSINFLLSNDEGNSPITIEGEEYKYSSCLLNTQKLHGVKNDDKDRILFKLSIFDFSFYQTRFKILEYFRNLNATSL